MNSLAHQRVVFFVFLVGLLSFASFARGQTSDNPVNSDQLPPDVRMVIDVSGSMKRNDPNNLRQPAVELLVQLLQEESRAGVWTFGRWVNMLVKHQDVDADWRKLALDKSTEINSTGLYTNIGEALEKATYDANASDVQHRRSIILLTDGMVDIDKDPSKNQTEWRRIVDEVLPKLKAAGFTIHTVALSDNADTDLLNKLSLGTDGIAAVAKTADDLMKIFLKAFDAAAPMEQVPLSDEGFVIDSSVEEFTALIFRKDASAPTQIVGPDQEVLTGQTQSRFVNWYSADNYDLITVKQPLEGQWQVVADMDPDSRITVVSNLNLRVRPLPVNIFRGQQEKLSFKLLEDGKTLKDPNFLKLMTIEAYMLGGRDEFDLQEIWREPVDTQAPPGNGVFEKPLPSFDKEGIYQLSLVVDGKSFVREFNHQFTTRQPFGADIKEVINEGRSEYILTARSFDPQLDISDTQVVATIVQPDRRKKIRPLEPSDKDTWQTTIRPEDEGEYLAQVRVRGSNANGDFDLALDDISFKYSVDAGFVEEEKPFFSPTPQPTPEATPEPTPEETPLPTPAPVEESPEDTGIPPWMLYSILGVGNLLLLVLGFIAFRKIMDGNNDEDVLEEFSEEKVAEAVSEAQSEETQDEFADPFEDPFEEEPPMEDIDPAMDDVPEPTPESSPPEPEPESEDAGRDLDDEFESMAMDSMGGDDFDLSSPEPDVAEDPFEEPEAQEETDDDPMDDLDDLEQMAVDAEEAGEDEESPESEEEDEDMVTAMLKAQGLDLAEEELDDAISSLIDELENDDGLDDFDDFGDDDDKK